MKYPLKRWKAVALSCLLLAGAVPALAQADDADILQAREAHSRRDTQRLADLRASAAAAQHPLASWVDYWELNNRLGEATQNDLNAFYERWRGSYVEDRLRNDWLLELGRRRDWTNFRVDHPRFRMNDDRQVICYALLADHLAGKDVRDAARAEWYAQRDSDDGCALLASTLHAERKLSDADVWQKLRLSIEFGRPRAAKLAAEMLGNAVSGAMDDVTERPARALTRAPATLDRTHAQLAALALAAIRPSARAGWRPAIPRPWHPSSRSAGSGACPPTLQRGSGRSPRSSRRRSCCRRRTRSSSAPSSSRARPTRRSTGPTTCTPGRRAPRCARSARPTAGPPCARPSPP